jgi:hypothetical protein
MNKYIAEFIGPLLVSPSGSPFWREAVACRCHGSGLMVMARRRAHLRAHFNPAVTRRLPRGRCKQADVVLHGPATPPVLAAIAVKSSGPMPLFRP